MQYYNTEQYKMSLQFLTNRDKHDLLGIVASIELAQKDEQWAEHMAQLIDRAGECQAIRLIGTGKAYDLAVRAESTFRSLGLNCTAFDACKLAHGDFGGLSRYDTIVLISKSGKTPELVFAVEHMVQKLGFASANIWSLTGLAEQEGINRYAGHVLSFQLPSELGTMGHCYKAPTTSCLLFSTVLDLIATKASYANEHMFKLYHPGGAIQWA